METLFIINIVNGKVETLVENEIMSEVEKENLTKVIMEKLNDVIPNENGAIGILNFDISKISKNCWYIGGSNNLKYTKKLGTSVNFKTVIKHIKKKEFDIYKIKCKKD